MLYPQHLRVLSVSNAQEWYPSAAAVTAVALEMPETVTAVVLVVVEPSPNCPLLLFPQHLRVLSVSNAQEWLEPVAIAVALAAALFKINQIKSKNVVIIISGGNVDEKLFQKALRVKIDW